jgi:hypothetical protein
MITSNPWSLSKKILFRFYFLWLSLSTLKCVILLFSRAFGFRNSAGFYKNFSPLFRWMDYYIFHSGYNPVKHIASPEDNHFGVVFYLTISLVSVVGAIVWTVVGRKTQEYYRARYWFRLYLSYVLALVLFFYGIDKVVPVQMPYPRIAALLTPVGENSRYSLFWSAMGLSPGYMIMTGLFEVAASFLLMNKRTRVFGYLLATVVLTNVVALNIFYNVPVKMFSMLLLLYAIFLLYPYIRTLGAYFLSNDTSSLAEKKYRFQNQWKNKILFLVLFAVPLILFSLQTPSELSRYKAYQKIRNSEKIYDINTFISKDTLPPLLTDTLRWKRLLFSGRNEVVIINMQDARDSYQFDVDSNKKTITFHDNPDTLTWHVFQYTYPASDQYSLTGHWKGRPVNIFMKSFPIGNLRLNKEKITLVND